ncbi:MAG: hypothetical protein ABJB12_08290 [Pseudomonadota bacterium]
MQNPTSSGLLMVVELGAEWPSASQAALGAASLRVLAEEESEAPAAFAVRVGEQLDALFARGIALQGAVLACSERLDESARNARADLARAVAGALARGTGGLLLLTASDRNGGRSRVALSALQQELAAEWQSAAIDTQLRFGDELAPVTSSVEVKANPRRNGKDRARRVA